MRNNENDRLYRLLENRICERIFRGDYADGENLPPERVLAESLNISRVTVRKALALLENDGIIERQQGSGNRVSLSLAGYPGTMDIIAVLARAQNAFFSAFIESFQRTAEGSDSLVLFKQNAIGEPIEESLFRLFQKNIRNAVIWLEDQPVDREAIRRLRGLGMNMVFFDTLAPVPFADGVLLDNEAAISSLYRALLPSCAEGIAYVGWAWSDASLASARERELVFRRYVAADSAIHAIAWHDKARLNLVADQIVDGWQASGKVPGGVLCGDGEIGLAIRKALNGHGLGGVHVASPDEYPESRSLAIECYRQDFGRMAEQTYRCLSQQNAAPWLASTYRIEGELLPSSDTLAP